MSEKLSDAYLLQTFLDHFTDYVYFKDRESRFLLINKELAMRYGLNDPSEAIGKNDYEFFTAEHADAAMQDEQEIVRTGKSVSDLHEKVTWVNGESTWVTSSKTPLLDPEGNIVGTFGVSRDITDRIRDQMAVEKLAKNLQVKNDEYESDLSIAAELQSALIPTSYPCFPASATPEMSLLQFSHRYHPSSKVGGDFFEVLTVSETEAGILFGDVMGHGVQSALIMAMIRALVVPSLSQARDPVQFLGNINTNLLTTLHHVQRNIFATACYATIDTTTGECCIANAGHLNPIWIQKSLGTCRWVPDFKPHGPLGLFEENDFPCLSLHLQPGDSLLFYTDGIVDVTNQQEVDFGKVGLLNSVATHLDQSMPALLENLITDTLSFSSLHAFEDDVCLLGVTFGGC